MTLGAPLVRGVIGALFVGHGTQKLFGWFGGPGLEGVSGMMDCARRAATPSPPACPRPSAAPCWRSAP